MNKLIKKICKYSIVYLIIMLFVVILFNVYNKSFVWINVSFDGLDQHFVNLRLLRNLLLGDMHTFFWNIGYGMDLFANFTYYIFGDFPSFISIFFPVDKLDIAYMVIIFLRVYLVGLSFIIYTKDKDYGDTNVIIGSILYTFSTYALFAMARHPYFLNAMIIFPILLLSVEKLVLENKKIFFIIMVFILFASSFYFGYMLSIIVMIYGIILGYKNFKDKRIVWKKVMFAIMYAIVGILIAGVVLLPTFEAFITSPRTGGRLYFYPLYYYPKLLASFISIENTGNWSIIGGSSILLLTLIMFFKDKKRNSLLLKFLIILLIPLLIPFVATIFDCMSFPNNRWAFVIPFIFSLITIEVLEKNIKIDIKSVVKIIIVYTIFVIILRMNIKVSEIISIILVFIFMYLINKKSKYILPVVIISIICNFYFMYDKKFGNYISEFASVNPMELLKSNNNKTPYLDKAVDFIKEYDNGFYNILVYPNELNNLGLANDFNSSSYFYSIVSKNYYDLASELNNQQMTMNGEIKNFNYRTRINELLNNKYLVTTDSSYHPYGYEVIKNFNNETYVLENKLGSSFVHLYTKSIKEDDYNKLSALEKEDALLKYYISSEGEVPEISKIESLPYQSNKTLADGIVNQKNHNDKLILNFNNSKNSELYLSINNLKRKNNKLLELLGDNDYKINVCLNKVCLSEWEDGKYTTAYNIPNGNILINLGYYDNLSGEIEVTFRDNGIYTFDSIELLMVNFDDYKSTIDNLNVDINDIKFGNDRLSFKANVLNDGILSFNTNYSKYFDIYIDNIKVDKKIINKYFLGCDINKGQHDIELIYHNTMINKGIYVSVLGIIIFSVIIVLGKKRKGVSYEEN